MNQSKSSYDSGAGSEGVGQAGVSGSSQSDAPPGYQYPPADPDDVPSLRRFWGLFRRQIALKAGNPEIQQQRIAAEKEMEAKLKQTEPRDRDLLLDQAREGYEEQDRRSDRSERRATTLLGSITIITTVVGVTSAILASSEVLKHAAPRIGLGCMVVVLLVFFGAAARWALSVVTTQDSWRRPATGTMLRARAERTDELLYAHTVAAFVDCIDWNRRIANYKARRLRNAGWYYGIALWFLLATVIAFPLLATIAPADTTSGTPGPQGPQGPTGKAGAPGSPGPPGRTVRTVVRAEQVRAALASRVMQASPGSRLRVRYALTRPSSVLVSIKRNGRVLRGVPDTASYGPNQTSIPVPSRGRYVVHVTARAANGTATRAEGILVVR